MSMMRQQQRVRFGKTEEAYDGFTDLLRRLIEESGGKRILDIGGGAQPQLNVSEVEEKGWEYTVMDISEAELARAPACYNKLVMDIAGDLNGVMGPFDLAFSRFVAEHVRSARRLHENVYELLRPGGLAVHLFPTLWSLPFFINWMLPEWLSVGFLSAERQSRGKFPAYYDWCVGPTPHSIARLERIGFEVVEYAGFFGHGYYDGVSLLRRSHGIVRDLLLRKPAAFWTSFAWVILRKPDDAGQSPDVANGRRALTGPTYE